MNYFDAHTHAPSLRPLVEVMCNLPCESASIGRMKIDHPFTYYTMGLHPCMVTEDDWEQQMCCLEEALSRRMLAAIGECGFDRRSPLDIAWQQRLFSEQIVLAHSYCLPLIVHCVRGYDLLLAQKRNIGTDIPVVLHGYRGGEKLTVQLLCETDFYFSIGTRFNLLSLKRIPLNRLLLESDMAECGVIPVYDQVAAALQIPLSEFSQIILENKKAAFFMTNKR